MRRILQSWGTSYLPFSVNVLNISSVFQLFPFHLTPFPSYSCLYSNISTLNYSSHNLQLPFLRLDSLGLSTARARSHRCHGPSPQPKVSSLISLWRSNSQLSSLQELAPLLLALCKEIHVCFVSLHCTSAPGRVSPTAGMCSCSHLQISWKDEHNLGPSPHTQTPLCEPQHVNLSPHLLIFYTLSPKEHVTSVRNDCSRKTSEQMVPRQHPLLTSPKLQKAFRPLLLRAAFNKRVEV